MHAVLDGTRVEFKRGDTILDAAQRLGIEIPTLCYDPAFPPEGGCRMCMVEHGPDGKTAAACHTPLVDGMEVRTTSERLKRLRNDILALTLSNHREDCFYADDEGVEIERVMAGAGVSSSTFVNTDARETSIDESHPYLRFNADRCILCRRCLHACESIQGQFVYGIEGRGNEASLVFGPDTEFVNSPCTACGACVDHCPTGAISDCDRLSETAPEISTRSTCGYCGVGCQIDIAAENGTVRAITGAADAAVNHGHLCAKGRYAHAYHHSKERLTKPMLRESESFREITWDEATRWAADRMNALRDAHGPDALGALASSRSTNEAAYLLQKLMRTVVGTNNVDCCARVCHSSTAMALKAVTGTGAASASYVDIEQARCIMIAGANPTEAHPVVGARIKQAVLDGVPLVVADPRRIELTEYADVHLALRPGTNVPLFNALATILLKGDQVDWAYVEERTEGLDDLTEFLNRRSVAEWCAMAGVDESDAVRAAAVLADNAPVLFVHGLGLSELTQGVDSIITLCNIGMLTGSIGRPGAGMLPLRGQNNVQGAADMGAEPGLATGYQSVRESSIRDHLKRVWGVAPPPEPGLTVTEMLDAALEQRIRGLWIQGEDLVQSDPYQSRTVKALESLDLLIVQDQFMNDTARLAHLVLPIRNTLENDGTYTNGERRVQRVRPAVKPPGMARADWLISRDIANAMGATWTYGDPSEVMDEIAVAAPKLFGGLAFDRLDNDGLQWPCPDRDHPGTSTVHEEGFLRGKGALTCVDYIPSPEAVTVEFPLLLITGRVLHQYNVATMTKRTPQRELHPVDVLEVHASDAERFGIETGATVAVESRWGQTQVPARVSSRVMPGIAFLSFHFPESHTNLLVGPHVDPKSKCPEYKVVAVRISPSRDN